MALDALTVAAAIELELKGNGYGDASPGFIMTNLNGFSGTDNLVEKDREAVRVALLGPYRPTGTVRRWENETIPWRQSLKGVTRSASSGLASRQFAVIIA
jgi:hypothetical protein